jgi:hypothetical protein
MNVVQTRNMDNNRTDWPSLDNWKLSSAKFAVGMSKTETR